MDSKQSIVIIGAGLTGCLLSIFLARRGFKVDVYERSKDMRSVDENGGRSINLALAHRGIRALKQAQVFERIKPMLVPMEGRQLHKEDGSQQFQAYSSKRNEVNYSLSRAGLNKELMTAAEATGLVNLHFEFECLGLDSRKQCINILNHQNHETLELPTAHVFACDGAGSRIRRDLVKAGIIANRDELLDHAYKELTIPANAEGDYLLLREALHIWPRGQYMLIALPNDDGSFTLTLFMLKHGDPGFSQLIDDEAISNFFKQHFPDVMELIPELLEDFKNNPEGLLGTVYSNPFHWDDKVLLLGDSSHAIVPFHGQGMNSGFEDCILLDQLLEEYEKDWETIFQQFSMRRKPDADAIAEMALENYITMRDSVRHPDFHLRKKLSFELETRFPDYFIPRYSMVMFHHIPYAQVFKRGEIQEKIISQLCEGVTELSEVDFAKAEDLIKKELTKIDQSFLSS